MSTVFQNDRFRFMRFLKFQINPINTHAVNYCNLVKPKLHSMKKISAYSLSILLLCFSLSIGHTQSLKSNSVYRIIQVIDTFNHKNWDSTSLVWIHNFTYDNQARPLTDTWDQYNAKGKLIVSNKLVYAYDNITGRLLSRIGDTWKYLYFYDPAGNLSRITLEVLRKEKWVLIEETIFKRSVLPENKMNLNIIWNKIKSSTSNNDSSVAYFNIDYTFDKDNNISDKKVNIYNYNKFKTPLHYKFYYDTHPNPLQQIILERFFDWDFDNQNSNNLENKKLLNSKFPGQLYYEYNEWGYPVKCIIDRVRTRLYKYQFVDVADQKTDQDSISEKSSSMMLYPNPARNEVNVKADNLGEGLAHIRIYDISERIYKELSYNVNKTLEALITLHGMPSGTYIVEIISGKIRISRKLILQ